MIELIYNKNQQTKATAIRNRRQMLATGFASPADSFVEKRLDTNDLLIQNPTATFFFRVKSKQSESSPFASGDVIIVDRSIPVTKNNYAVAVVDNNFLLVHFINKNNRLVARCIKTNEVLENDLQVWGVITRCIKFFQ